MRPTSRRCAGWSATVGLVCDRKLIQQRLHDQLNVLAPGLSAPAGHGRRPAVEQPTGQAVLACAAVFAGRAPTVPSLQAPAGSAAMTPSAGHSAGADAYHRRPMLISGAERLSRDLARYQALQGNIIALEADLEPLLHD
jgi:hypothetical protein